MTAGKLSRSWTLVTILVVFAIIAGAILAWSRYAANRPVEISINQPSQQGETVYIYIGGAVNNPGFYHVRWDDSIEALIQAAGGIETHARNIEFRLHIAPVSDESQPQKIDLNRAQAWLLEALPGIGETRAQAIIDYRQQQGLFRNINELTKVEGIGVTTYEKIKDFVTVAD